MNPAKRVLLIASRSDIAGGENYLLSILRYMDRERFQPIVILPGRGLLAEELAKLDVEAVIIEADYGWVHLPISWYTLLEGLDGRVRRIAQIIKEQNIVLVHTNSNMRLEGALAARLVGIPHIYLAHIAFQTDLPIFRRLSISPTSFAQLMGDLSSHIVAVSRSVADELCPPVSVDKITVIHNGLEFGSFDECLVRSRNCIRRELGLADGAILVTAVGRIVPDKGTDYFLEIASQVVSQRRNVHFLHVGGDDDKTFGDRLRGDALRTSLNGQFHFLGFRKDVPRILAETDIFVLPSRREGHPYVLLEAMASGCAAVASRCGGVEETIVEGVTAFSTEIGDVGAMSKTILKLVDDGQLRAKIGAAAREYVREHFNAPRSAQALFEIYEKVLIDSRPTEGGAAVDLFLRGAHELGSLGCHYVDLEKRLRPIEDWVRLIRQSLPFRFARGVRDVWRRDFHRHTSV